MAIIKCPECGHQVSDKAPFCPSCGVEIADKITKCPYCGDIYFKEQQLCPSCHRAPAKGKALSPDSATGSQEPSTATPVPAPASSRQPVSAATSSPATSPPPSRLAATPAPEAPSEEPPAKKKNLRGPLLTSFMLTLIICGVCFYYYKQAKDKKELEAYEYAVKSNEPLVLQSFLDTYKDATDDHRDAILSRLTQLRQMDQEWTNALVSRSKKAFQQYAERHPDSPHRADALNKIDSIDWAAALAANSLEGFRSYTDEHPNGTHADEAGEKIKAINAQTVQAEEQQKIAQLFRHFFQSINSKDEDTMLGFVTDRLTSFLGKSDATKADVQTFLHKIYKEDVANMNWRLGGDYKIEKKEVGDEQFEYKVAFTATQDVEYTNDSSTKSKYHINARVNPAGKITEMNMTKLLE